MQPSERSKSLQTLHMLAGCPRTQLVGPESGSYAVWQLLEDLVIAG